MFCVTFNGAGPKPQEESIGQIITQPRKSRKPIGKGKKMWVDDLSLYVPIRLHDKLTQDTREPLIGPVSYHNRTGQVLPEHCNEMQSELDSLKKFCSDSKMSINKKKTRCMLFNRAIKHDFMPELQLEPDNPLGAGLGDETGGLPAENRLKNNIKH